MILPLVDLVEGQLNHLVYGKKEDTGEIRLTKSTKHNDPFETGQVDLFTVEAGDVGKVHYYMRFSFANFWKPWSFRSKN